jgi:anthranilate synthase component 1
VESQEKVGRFSFLGSDPKLTIKTQKDSITLKEKGKRKRNIKGNPFEKIKELLAGFKFVEVKGVPRFCGGLVGYLGYDVVRFIEEIPDNTEDDLKLPDSYLMLQDTVLIFDNVNKTLKIVANAYIDSKDNLNAAYKKAIAAIEEKEKQLNKKVAFNKKLQTKKRKVKTKVESNFSKYKFKKIVSKAKDYIKKGDVIQVVLSQRFRRKISTHPFNIYRSLRAINPSPYMFYLKFDDLKLVGSSPEIMVRLEEDKVQVRPIAGTRPRGINEKEDEKLIKDLLSDPKEKAEHIMLVDLGRNDIGRICKSGSINVSELMSIEKYSHVIHLVSDCAGRLKKGKDMIDVVKSTFPAGTVTGAPKIKAMQIIDQLEQTRRGPYAGAVIYFSFSGNLDSCITIRTIVINKDTAYIQAGAGIVADSKPENEYRETLNKAQGMLKAIEAAEEGKF